MGWKALDSAVEVSSPSVCSEFYESTKAKACIELEDLASVVESETKDFADEFATNQFKILNGIETQIEKYGEAKQKIDEASSSFSNDVKSAFGTAGDYINKYSTDVNKIRSVINECNMAQQVNSFGIFCLMSSDLASKHITAGSVLESGLQALSVSINPASSIEMANRCADAIKNTCLFLEIEKAITLYDGESFVSGFESKCLPDFLDCVNLGEEGSGCSDAIKKKLFENFSSGVMGKVFDEETQKVLDNFSDKTSDLFDKLKTHGFGPIKEGAEGAIQTIKGYIDSFSLKDLGEDIKNTAEDIGDSIKDTFTGAADGIKDAFSNPFRILEAKAEFSYQVSDDGYNSYEHGQKSNMNTHDSISRLSSLFSILLSFMILK
jgi:hypothetical protein